MLELILCVLIFLLLFIDPTIRAYFKKLKPSYLICMVLFFCFMLVGQVIANSRLTFPFLKWDMYRRIEHAQVVENLSLLGVRKDGSKVVLVPGKVFPSLAHGRLMLGLERRVVNTIILQTKSPNSKRFKYEKYLLNSILQALIKQYNLEHHDKPIKAIEVVKIDRSLDLQAKKPLRNEVIWRMDNYLSQL